MKKILAIVLSVAIICCFSINAFAETLSDKGSTTCDLEATFSKTEGSVSSDKSYYVIISWDTSDTREFELTGAIYTWNAENCVYERTEDPGYDFGGIGCNCTIINQSNDSVNYAFTYEPNADAPISTYLFGNNHTGTLASAAPDTSGYNFFDCDSNNTWGEPTAVEHHVLSLSADEINAEKANSTANGTTVTLGTFTCTIS